jgi:hypothetical protein
MVLSVVAVAQLIVVLDSTIVNIALPSAQRALARWHPGTGLRNSGGHSISEFRANHGRTTKSNAYVKFSARAIDHPLDPGQLPVDPHPSIREETPCPASPRPSRPTICHAS